MSKQRLTKDKIAIVIDQDLAEVLLRVVDNWLDRFDDIVGRADPRFRIGKVRRLQKQLREEIIG